jgi:hypothetical protein
MRVLGKRGKTKLRIRSQQPTRNHTMLNTTIFVWGGIGPAPLAGN